MLTEEVLKANESLKDLTAEQIQTIATLSENDENTVIGQKFGEVYRQMDATIEKATGVKRNGDEKTYVYLERAAKEFTGKYGDYEELKTKVADLEKQVAQGGDAAIKAQLEQAKNELAATKEQFNNVKAELDKANTDHANALLGLKVDAEIAKAKEGFTFKQGFSEAVMNTLIGQAIANVKAKHPTFEESNGASVLVFKDDKGVTFNNPENKLNPYTAKELLQKEFEAMDILEKNPAKGAGSHGSGSSAQTTLAGVATQVQANETITKMLLERGIAKTSLKFGEEYQKLWDENRCGDLPLQ